MEQILVEDLNHKLSHLEHKLRAYRRDLVCEFGRYYGERLRGVDDSTAARVSSAVSQSLDDLYPALSSDMELDQMLVSINANPQPDVDGPQPRVLATSATRPGSNTNIESSESISPHRHSPPKTAVFGAAVGAAASPHERETEFHGLFTPFFLPLLESSPNLSTRPTTASLVSSVEARTSHEPAIAGLDVDATMDKEGRQSVLFDATSLETRAPQTEARDVNVDVEKQTETTKTTPSLYAHPEIGSTLPIISHESSRKPRRSSLHHSSDDQSSEKSELITRRSALRRSSSVSNKPHHQSARRVRFDLRGAEVLPTASPQPSDNVMTLSPVSSAPSDKPPILETVVGDIDDFEKESVPPRKISSSEALRALSRTPLDESTVWTVVNPDADNALPARTQSPPRFANNAPTKSSIPQSIEAVEARRRLGAIGASNSFESLEESESSADEDFLSMGKPKPHRTDLGLHLGASPDLPQATNGQQTVQPVSHEIQQADAPGSSADDHDAASSDDPDVDDDDGMFHFESGGLSAPPVSKRKLSLVRDETEASPPLSPRDDQLDAQIPFATSPAVPIARPYPSSGSSTPTSSKFHVGSLGSYKGRPVVMPVVKNPELLAQAESLGGFTTFVGGLDGRSGIDDGDLSSFRASLIQGGFSGTPRSMTERMMMEDHAKEAAGRK